MTEKKRLKAKARHDKYVKAHNRLRNNVPKFDDKGNPLAYRRSL